MLPATIQSTVLLLNENSQPYRYELQRCFIIFIQPDALEGRDNAFARPTPLRVNLEYCNKAQTVFGG